MTTIIRTSLLSLALLAACGGGGGGGDPPELTAKDANFLGLWEQVQWTYVDGILNENILPPVLALDAAEDGTLLAAMGYTEFDLFDGRSFMTLSMGTDMTRCGGWEIDDPNRVLMEWASCFLAPDGAPIALVRFTGTHTRSARGQPVLRFNIYWHDDNLGYTGRMTATYERLR